jgi:hypothetical protein
MVSLEQRNYNSNDCRNTLHQAYPELEGVECCERSNCKAKQGIAVSGRSTTSGGRGRTGARGSLRGGRGSQRNTLDTS